MSSSYRRGLRVAAALASVAAAAFAPGAYSQVRTIVPGVEATAAYDTNPLLLTGNRQSGETYSALFGLDFKQTDVRSDFEIRPEVKYQDASVKQLSRWEAQLDLKGNYRTQRQLFTMAAQYHRQDLYNAEYGIAAFNPINPGTPDTTGTGTIVTGLTRTNYYARPDYNLQVTERWSVDASVLYAAVRYSTDIPGQYVSYNSPYFEVDSVWDVTQRGQLAIGPFYTKYDPINNDAFHSDSFGANLSYRFLFSKIFPSTISVKLARNDTDIPGQGKVGANTWGIEWTGTNRWPTSSLVYVIGRTLEPSSIGGEVTLTQVRVQYSKMVTQRLSYGAAARISRSQGVQQIQLIAGDINGNKDRANLEATVRYNMTRLLYVQGGYRLAYQKLSDNPHSGLDNGVFLTFGFHGRDPTPRMVY